MPVPFGFSVGDLIAGIKLIIDAIQSLNETTGARANYNELARELVNLNKALEHIQNLGPDIADPGLVTAVDSAVKDCNTCVEGFMRRNNKFSGLGTVTAARWSLSALKTRGKMMQWALCKKSDVARFREEVQKHVDGIQMLLAMILVKQNSQQGAKHKSLIEGVSNKVSEMGNEQQNLERVFTDQLRAVRNDLHAIGGRQSHLEQTITQQTATIKGYAHLRDQVQKARCMVLGRAVVKVQADIHKAKTQVDVLRALEESMTGGTTQYQQDLLHILRQTATQSDTIILNQEAMISNQQKMLTNLHDIVTISRVQQYIPPQVTLSSPIVFLDARSRRAGFHIEFIDSIEAFIAVLRIRFEDLGLHKIERRQFALEDSGRKRNLPLPVPWLALVRPGQHISMSMIFRLQESPTTRCPGCGTDNAGLNVLDIECGNTACGMTYRRIQGDVSQVDREHGDEADETGGQKYPPSAHSPVRHDVVNYPDELEDDVKHYTRVHILTHPLGLANKEETEEQAKRRSCQEDVLEASADERIHNESNFQAEEQRIEQQ